MVAVSWTVLSGEEEEQKSYQESAGLRTGRREEKRPSQQIPEQLPLPPGREPRGQLLLPPQLEGTTRAATADPNTGATGRGPGCNRKSPIRGDREEGAHTAGAGPPAAEAPPAGGAAVPRVKGALGGGGAEESYPANTTPGGTGEEAQGHFSQAAQLPPATGSEPRSEGERAKWSPGRRSIVRGPDLLRLLKERLEEANGVALQSAWQDVELVWWVLLVLVAGLDLGGMGPLVARALDPQRMALVKKDVSEYVGVAILFYE